MFKSVELGHKLSKATFEAELPKLRSELLEAHEQLRSQKFSVLVVIAGADAAGKGQVVQQLNEWLDPHGVETHAFWESGKEKKQRPEYARYWMAMPGRGRIGIFFGSWYSEPMLRRVYGKSKNPEFSKALPRISLFEKTLTDDGTVIVKIWLHLSQHDQEAAIKKLEKEGRSTQTDWKHFKLYDKFIKVSERIVSQTDSGNAPWHLVEAADRRHRDYTCGTILLAALKQKLSAPAPITPEQTAETPKVIKRGELSILDKVDLSQQLSEKEYRKALDSQQTKLSKLMWAAHEKKRSMILVFEGWDAAGKGSAIRRVIEAMDPRLYRVVGISAPTDEERAQHYLWRFWRRLPRPGSSTIFDRSWYGRVLVERVEGFAPVADWSRAYLEINEFEDQLVSHGIVLNKFWIHISPEEQLRRFEERQKVAYKQYKITDEDWRNRKKWNDYKGAVNDMVTRCDTKHAPWTLVAGNDKKFARIQILRTVVQRLQEAL